MFTYTAEPQFNDDAPYELIVIDKTLRQIHRKRFDNIKDAVAFVSPAIFLDHERDYLILNHRKSSSNFIKLNKSTNESYAHFRILQSRSNDSEVFHTKSASVSYKTFSEILRDTTVL
ncbi:MAG: hypothetical protein EBR30_27035 [Cytophagia bacterium]|nr:hypothetical protein [Cytophagia bacterium]